MQNKADKAASAALERAVAETEAEIKSREAERDGEIPRPGRDVSNSTRAVRLGVQRRRSRKALRDQERRRMRRLGR